MKSALERFCDNIVVEPNTGCHLWSGNSDKNGYGKIYVDRQHLRAHRFSYKIFNGEATKDCLICHKCDTPACVNPEHLFIGTPKENMQDKIRKGRLKNQWTNRNLCKRGHEFTQENTLYKEADSGNQVKYCRTCYTERYKRVNRLISERTRLKNVA